MTRLLLVAAAVVATLLAAAFFCPIAAAAFYANPDADVQIVGLPGQVYAGGESFFIIVLANDQPFFDESLDEEGAVGVCLNITNGVVTAIEGSTFATNTSVGYDNITLYQDYISEWNCTLAVVRFAPTGAGDAVHINASGWIKDKDKPLFSDRYVATDSDDASSEIIDYSNLYDVSTLSELALQRKAFYNNSIKMLGAIVGDGSIDSQVNMAWFGAIMWTESLSYTLLTAPTTPVELVESFDEYTNLETYSFGLDTVFMSLESIIDQMWTVTQYTGKVSDAQNELRDLEDALTHESEYWTARNENGLEDVFGWDDCASGWLRGEELILERANENLRRVIYEAKKDIDAGTSDEADLYAYNVAKTALAFGENDLKYVRSVRDELPVDSDGDGLFDFENKTEPIPSLTNLEPSVEIAVGETRDLVFTLTNAGNDSDVGYLDLSVSSGIEIVANSSDAADMLNYTLAPGKDAYFSDGSEHPLTYSLFGAYKPYAEGESAIVTITIKATAAGEGWLKYRLSMMNSSDEYIRIPNAGVKDQQGWYAHETTVTVIDPANVAPAADAGCDQEVSEGTAVTLNGSGSSDTDGAVVEYVWREGGSVIGRGCVIGRTFSAGTHTVVLTVTDDGGKSDSDTVVVAVTANSAPVADAGCDQSVASGAVVTLDGSGSSDDDGTIEYYEWQEGGVFLESGVTLETVFAPGVHEVTLYVVDDGGKVGGDEVRVEVAVNVTFEGRFGGTTHTVAVSGNYAYIGQGWDLVVLDVSSQDSPVELGRVMTPGIVSDVVLSGDYAYVANWGNGLVIVDVSNKAAPSLAGSYDTAEYAWDVAVLGDYAYVADRGNGLVIVDVSDKSTPSLAGSYDIAGWIYGVAVSGDYAYVADGDGLVIVDVSSKSAPVFAGSYDTGYARGVAVSGDYAYVADNDRGLMIVDVSDKSAPSLAGSCATAEYVYDVAVSGNYAYVANYYNGLVIVDVSDKSAPSLAGSYDTAGHAYDVAVSGDYAYVADRDNGLVIVNVRNKAAPSLAGSYDTAEYAEGVAVSGDYAYIADGNGLVIVDVSSKSAPVFAGSYDTGYAVDVAVSGDYAYVAAGNGLVIVDVSDKTAPSLAGSYDTAGWKRGVAVSGDYAYVADYGNGLVIVDVSDKAAPVLAGGYDTVGDAYGAAVSGDYAYVADYGNGLVIVDVSDKAAPVLAGGYDTAGDAYGVAVSGDYAYVACGYYGLVIVDVSDKTAPSLAGSYDTGYAVDVAVSGDYAYVAAGNGLVIVDVSDKTAPSLAGSYDTAGCAYGVAVSGDYAYVADYWNGLVILHTDASGADTTPPTLTITSPVPNTTTHTPTITVAGTASDASGIASVTVNGEPANGTLDWSANVTLIEGENTITVIATDGAGLTTTKTVTVYRIESFTFVHITDVHIGYWPSDDTYHSEFLVSIEKFTDTLQATKTHSPEFILSPGDLVEYSKEDFFNAYMGISKSLDIPLYNTPGNHDRRGWDPRDDVGLTTYDEIIKNPGDIKPLNDGYRDYYFDRYGYRFIGLDSGADYNVSLPPFLKSSNVSTLASYDYLYDHSPEGDGLKEIQLTGLSEMDSEMPKVIFMHHPAVSDSDDESAIGSLEPPVTNNCPPEYGGNDACIAFNRCGFIDYCINNNADLVLTGHTHWDYVKTVFNEPETHKTWFIQTRSATKDPDPYNYHGYRVIKITDEGVIPHMSEMTEDTLRSIERYTYSAPSNLLDHIRIYAYVISGSNVTGILPDDTVKREIPDSYYTGVLDELPQIIRCYNEKPDKFKFGLKLLPADTSDTTSQKAIEEASTNFNIIMKHQTENMTATYIYEDITFGTSENATAVVDLDPANVNYTMEIDYDGDGIIDDTTDPTHITINYAPEISITTPTGDQRGNVTIPYNLKDAESDDCTIIAQYSLDNIIYLDASVGEGGDGMINLASAPAGVDHAFVWASGIDIPQTNATVYFRIRPYDGDLAGDYATTDAFSVANRGVRGDLNGDHLLTPADAAIALKIAAGSRPCDAAMLDAADVSGDGCVTSLDALMILQGCG